MIKQTITQKQLQKLSPQQIQLMKLLQIPTALLEQRIQEEIEANPALEDSNRDQEEEEEFDYKEDIPMDEMPDDKPNSNDDDLDEDQDYEQERDLDLESYLEDYANDDEVGSYRLENNLHGPDEEKKERPTAIESSFYEYLEQQLGLLELNPDEHLIAQQIIGTIDEDGYLRRDVSALVDDLAFGQNLYTNENTVLRIIQLIQSFEPAGVAARNLQECLQLQLERKVNSEETNQYYQAKQLRYLKLALEIIRDYFDEFSKKHYSKLLRSFNLFEEELKEIQREILQLNPKPGSAFMSNSMVKQQYIIPDFIIENKDGYLDLSLHNRNTPELRVSDHFRELLQSYNQNPNRGRQDKEALTFVKQKIDSAKWFIDAIKSRQDTMFKTMAAILERQKEYFLTGDEKKIRPMILKDIADKTNLDISTISRVANSKYVQTEFGTKRLKDFFSESMQMDTGEEVSTVEVKKILEDVVKAEDKRNPHSDEKLKDMLLHRGYNIARRTVAKYREQLGIPVARLRKQI